MLFTTAVAIVCAGEYGEDHGYGINSSDFVLI